MSSGASCCYSGSLRDLSRLAHMDKWRTELNRLAVEFQYGVGSIDEARAWCDVANAECGEVHPQVWTLIATTDEGEASELLTRMAVEVNTFDPHSPSAEPFAMRAMQRLIERFLARRLSVQQFCSRVNELDSTFVTNAAFTQNPSANLAPHANWLGNLWNCCDWLPESSTHEDVPELLAEVERVRDLLANVLSNRTPDGVS